MLCRTTERFSSKFSCSPKEFSRTFPRLLGECAEVSSFNRAGQEQISPMKENISGRMQSIAHVALELCKRVHLISAASACYCAPGCPPSRPPKNSVRIRASVFVSGHRFSDALSPPKSVAPLGAGRRKFPFSAIRLAQKKSRNPKAPAVQLVVCPDKLFYSAARFLRTELRCAFEPPSWRLLRAPPRPHRQVAHLRQNARHLHATQLRQKRHDVGYEWIFHQLAHLLLPTSFSARKQIGHADLERPRQPLQRRQRRSRLLIFNFRDVGARHRHAQPQLPLTQSIAQPQRSDRVRQPQVAASSGIHMHRHHLRRL